MIDRVNDDLPYRDHLTDSDLIEMAKHCHEHHVEGKGDWLGIMRASLAIAGWDIDHEATRRRADESCRLVVVVEDGREIITPGPDVDGDLIWEVLHP